MPTTDLSIEALLVRREIAEKATPGPWEKMFETAVGTDNGHQVPLRIASTNFESDAAHIAANSPDVVIATIDELLRLRAECARLEREANWLAGYLTIGAHESYDAARRRWRDAARKAVEEA